MSWIILFFAGLFEVGWAVGLKYTEGFSKPLPTVLTALAMLVSLGLLGLGQGPVLRILQEFFQPCQVLLDLFILLPGLHQGSQILLLPVEFGHQVRVGVGLRLGQLGLHLLEAEGCLTQLRCQGRHQACPSPSWALAFSACSSASRRW